MFHHLGPLFIPLYSVSRENVSHLFLFFLIYSLSAAAGLPCLGRGRPGRRGRDARMPFQPVPDGQTSHFLLDPAEYQREGQRRYW